MCFRAGAISSAPPPPHTASKCADTRESKKLSAPTSSKDIFHEEADGKFVSPMLFHFSRAFFTGDGRPEMQSKINDHDYSGLSQVPSLGCGRLLCE